MGTTAAGVKSYAIDPALARQLWPMSDELVGEGFAPD
jgi:hypothetical protein